jgi:hypothetical protein
VVDCSKCGGSARIPGQGGARALRLITWNDDNSILQATPSVVARDAAQVRCMS